METRRSFLSKTLTGLAAASLPGFKVHAYADTVKSVEDFAVFNPYEGIDWRRYRQVVSVSHVHIKSQDALDRAYTRMKVRHLPISNYYPSAPCYPAADALVGEFRPRQDFGVVHKGQFVEGPIDWNRVITDDETGWAHELPEAKRRELPLKSGGKMFQHIPDDLIFSPNAEHHSFTNTSLHANSLGSLYAGGTFDSDRSFLTVQHGYSSGMGVSWEEGFARMLEPLLFPDGGGITINHPTWSNLPFPLVCQMLDFDSRVLGIEVFNNTCALGYGDPGRGWAYQLWDDLLATGRKCFGFFTPDHAIGRGQNVLVVPEFTEHECLRAYRRGAFYGAVNGTGLQFTNITLRDGTLFVALNKPGVIRLASNKGEVRKVYGVAEMEYKIPVDSEGRPTVSYLRAEAYDDTSEQLFAQPILFGASVTVGK